MYTEFEAWYDLQLTKTKRGLEKTYRSIQKDYDYWKQFVILNNLRRSERNFYLGKIQSLKLKLNTLTILIQKYEGHVF